MNIADTDASHIMIKFLFCSIGSGSLLSINDFTIIIPYINTMVEDSIKANISMTIISIIEYSLIIQSSTGFHQLFGGKL